MDEILNMEVWSRKVVAGDTTVPLPHNLSVSFRARQSQRD